MKNNYGLKSIEEIALEYLRNQDIKFIKNGLSSDTTVDTRIYEKEVLKKKNSTLILNQSPNNINGVKNFITKGKLIETSKINNHLIDLYKISPKKLDEDTFNYQEFTSSTFISKTTLKENTIIINFNHLRKIQKLNYNNKLFFHFCYSNIYDGITELYIPLLNYMESIVNFKSLIINGFSAINFFFNNISVFELHKRTNLNLSKFIEDEKICELIEFNILLLLFDNIYKEDEKNFSFFNDEIIDLIFQDCYFIMQKLYTNLMLKLLYNDIYYKENNKYINTDYNWNKNEEKTKFNINNCMKINEASFEALCFKYVKDFFKGDIKLNKQQIINKINYNLLEAYKCLFELINDILVILNSIQIEKYSNKKINEQKINKDDLNYSYEQFNIILNFFNCINNYLNKIDKEDENNEEKDGIKSVPDTKRRTFIMNKTKSKIKNDFNKTKNIKKFYKTNRNYNSNLSIIYNNTNFKKIQEYSSQYKEIYKPLLLKYKINIPYLPPIDKTKYIYTLVIDLDETLIHYIEEDDKSFIQVRPYVPYFLTEMGKYFELVVFTAAEEDYANFVLEQLDKNKLISYKLFRRHTKPRKGVFLKDLSRIGRELNKICIIDNNKDNFKMQPHNGIKISSFIGDQNDDELLFLSHELMKIIKSNKNDIRPIIREINENMNKRNIKINNL